ncbi:MAG: hypothetical protein ACLPKB_31105 [Xanthobacteraceae bacterium]
MVQNMSGVPDVERDPVHIGTRLRASSRCYSRLIEQGKVPVHEASLRKAFASEWQKRLGHAALDVLGMGGLLSEDAGSATVRDTE